MPDTALLIIDIQPTLMPGAHDEEGFLSRVAGLADRARAAGVPVIYIRQRHKGDVHPTVAPQPGDVVLDKDNADSFLDSTLGELLRERTVRRLVVTGYATDYCVDSTARGALSRGYDLVLVADGHSTPERPAGPSAAQIIAHHNAIFTNIQYKGPSIAVTPAVRVSF